MCISIAVKLQKRKKKKKNFDHALTIIKKQQQN